MPRHYTDPSQVTSSAGYFARLLLIIFGVDLVEMWLLFDRISRLGLFQSALTEAALLTLGCAPLIWYAVVRPLACGNAVGAGPRLSPAGLFIKVLTVIFLIEFPMMLFLPVILPGAGIATLYLADASITTFSCGPLLWWTLSKEQRSHIDSLNDLLKSPVKLYAMLLAWVFMVEMVEMPLIASIAPGREDIFSRFVDAFLTVLIIAPLSWWFIIRPLRIAAQSEKSSSDAVRAQVVEAIVTIDELGAVENFNPAAEMIFGYTTAEINGKPANLLFGGAGPGLDELMRTATATENRTVTPVTHEVVGRRRDGSSLTMDVSLSRILYDGRWQLLLIMRDISGRRKMESALRESEELFRSLSESSPVGVFHIDPEGNCLYTNQRWQEIAGLSAAESLGVGWTQVDHPEDKQTVCAEWRRSVAEGRDFMHEFRLLTPRGEVRWVLARTAALRSADDRIIGYVGTYEEITERKRAEQELQKSLSLLGAILESTADGILAIDAERRVLTFNQKFLDMWRIPRHLAEGCDGYQLIDLVREQLHDPEAFVARIEELNSQPETTALDLIRLKDGGVIERYSQAELLEGKSIGRVWSFRDVTAATEAEEALRESEERFKIAVNGANDGIWDWNIQSETIYFTPRLKEMLGYTVEEFPNVTGTFEGLLHPEDHDRVVAAVRAHLKERTPYDIECRLRTREGDYRWFRTRGRAVWDETGRPLRMAGSITDITKRKEADEALRESEERFRQLFEQSEDAIIFFKPGSCYIIDANATTEQLYGYSKAELKEAGLERLTSPEDFARVSSAVSGIRRGEMSYLDRIVNLRKDGAEIIVSMRGKIVTIRGVDLVYCTFRNVTERIRLEEEARNIQARLIQANKMTSLGLLVSGVAHEINNPNNFIMANSQLLARAWDDALKILREYYRENGDFLIGGIPFSEMAEQSPQLFAGIVDGARRINEIVNNLKSFARRDRVMTGLDVDVNQVVTAAVSILHHQLVRHTENFHLDLAENIPRVKGSSQQLEQVVINLLMNACQALPAKQCGIWVATGFDAAADRVTIAVRDEGGGMSRELGDRIMEPFFTTRLDSGGTGLGLSISHSIVKEHNGSLEFESEPGKGTTFIVKIPAGEAAVKEPSA
ncbi:MAG: PAS domain S-box protein [Geobacteraceae bacterium]|nr:PAS domain S-box protein [Geobacteraceae bacterium]